MHIIGVEEATRNNIGNSLKFTLKFDYSMGNLALDQFGKVILNNQSSNGWSLDYDDDTGYYYLYVASNEALNKIKSITFGELVYKINDEYQIDLGRWVKIHNNISMKN